MQAKTLPMASAVGRAALKLDCLRFLFVPAILSFLLFTVFLPTFLFIIFSLCPGSGVTAWKKCFPLRQPDCLITTSTSGMEHNSTRLMAFEWNVGLNGGDIDTGICTHMNLTELQRQSLLHRLFRALWYIETLVTPANAQFHNLCIFLILSFYMFRHCHHLPGAYTRYVLKKCWYKPFEDGDNVETCRS